MSFGFPQPVTRETFPDAWKYAGRKLRWAKKRGVIARTILPLAHPFYTAAMAFLSFGIFYGRVHPLVTKYLNQQPGIVAVWQKFQGVIYASAETEAQKRVVWAVLLYLIPFALSVVLALLISLCYYPKGRKPDPSDSAMEQARQMCITLREAKAASKAPKSHVVGFCNFAFALVWCVVILGFLLFCQKEPSVKAWIEENTARFNVALFAAFVVLAAGYWLLSLPLTLAQRLLTLTIVPKKAMAAAEDWFVQCEAASDSANAQEAPQPTAAEPAQHASAQEG